MLFENRSNDHVENDKTDYDGLHPGVRARPALARPSTNVPGENMKRKACVICGIVVVAAFVSVGITACGSSDGATTASDATEGNSLAQTSPVETLEADLRGAGFLVQREPSSNAEAAISTGPHGEVNVYLYATAGEAAAAGQEIKGIFANHPGKGQVRVIDNYVVDTASESPLTPDEEQAFGEVVSLVKESE